MLLNGPKVTVEKLEPGRGALTVCCVVTVKEADVLLLLKTGVVIDELVKLPLFVCFLQFKYKIYVEWPKLLRFFLIFRSQKKIFGPAFLERLAGGAVSKLIFSSDYLEIIELTVKNR